MFKAIKKFIKNKLNITSLNSGIDELRNAGAKIGSNVHISPPIYFQVFEARLREIHDWVTIAPYVTFICHDSSAVSVFIEENLRTKFGKIVIKNNVYIGARTILMPGVEIGEYSIIGAGSIITKDVPSYSLVIGSPGEVVLDTREFLKKWKNKQKTSNDKIFFVDWGLPLKDFSQKYPRNSEEHNKEVYKIINVYFDRFLK